MANTSEENASETAPPRTPEDFEEFFRRFVPTGFTYEEAAGGTTTAAAEAGVTSTHWQYSDGTRRDKQQELTYGEITCAAVRRLMQMAKRDAAANGISDPADGKVFLDLGSGAGKGPLVVAALSNDGDDEQDGDIATFQHAIGIELSKQRHDIAVEAKWQLGRAFARARTRKSQTKSACSVHLVHGDLLRDAVAAIAAADVIWISNMCFTAELNRKLGKLLDAYAKPGCLVYCSRPLVLTREHRLKDGAAAAEKPLLLVDFEAELFGRRATKIGFGTPEKNEPRSAIVKGWTTHAVDAGALLSDPSCAAARARLAAAQEGVPRSGAGACKRLLQAGADDDEFAGPILPQSWHGGHEVQVYCLSGPTIYGTEVLWRNGDTERLEAPSTPVSGSSSSLSPQQSTRATPSSSPKTPDLGFDWSAINSYTAQTPELTRPHHVARGDGDMFCVPLDAECKSFDEAAARSFCNWSAKVLLPDESDRFAPQENQRARVPCVRWRDSAFAKRARDGVSTNVSVRSEVRVLDWALGLLGSGAAGPSRTGSAEHNDEFFTEVPDTSGSGEQDIHTALQLHPKYLRAAVEDALVAGQAALQENQVALLTRKPVLSWHSDAPHSQEAFLGYKDFRRLCEEVARETGCGSWKNSARGTTTAPLQRTAVGFPNVFMQSCGGLK